MFHYCQLGLNKEIQGGVSRLVSHLLLYNSAICRSRVTFNSWPRTYNRLFEILNKSKLLNLTQCCVLAPGGMKTRTLTYLYVVTHAHPSVQLPFRGASYNIQFLTSQLHWSYSPLSQKYNTRVLNLYAYMSSSCD